MNRNGASPSNQLIHPIGSPAVGQVAEPPVETPQVLLEHPLKLLRLCELEVMERERRSMERRIRHAHFPVLKSLESFDFAAIPSLNKLLVSELARCDYIECREIGISCLPERSSRSLCHGGFFSARIKSLCPLRLGGEFLRFWHQ